VDDELLILEPRLDAPSLARSALRDWMAHEDLAEVNGLEDRVLLVVSELVTNAVVHARTRLEVWFAADDRTVAVVVSDHDLDGSRLVGPAVCDEPADGTVPMGGRGLAIVDALADDWGVAETTDGKRVWARWAVRERC
jgi:anti-sigma regulatory factor (Ser/Thr protein kinase)